MDPEAFKVGMAGSPSPRRRGRPKRRSRAELFKDELARCDREDIDPIQSRYLMTELARIALGPQIDLGPMMIPIGQRVKEICDIAIDKAME